MTLSKKVIDFEQRWAGEEALDHPKKVISTQPLTLQQALYLGEKFPGVEYQEFQTHNGRELGIHLQLTSWEEGTFLAVYDDNELEGRDSRGDSSIRDVRPYLDDLLSGFTVRTETGHELVQYRDLSLEENPHLSGYLLEVSGRTNGEHQRLTCLLDEPFGIVDIDAINERLRYSQD